MGYRLGKSTHRRADGSRIRQAQNARRAAHPLLGLQQTAGNQAVWGALSASRAEAEADRVADVVAAAAEPTRANEPARLRGSGSGERFAPSLRGRLEALLGWDLGATRVRVGDGAGRDARALGARAFTRGSDIVFGEGSFRPDTRAGLGLLGHELAHAHQQAAGQVPWAAVQKKEDWDFTPADYKSLLKDKQDLRFGADSGWFPKALQENLLTTLKFTLTSTKPVRTKGVNIHDFYHGHFVVPKGAMTEKLTDKRSAFSAKEEALQAKGRGGESFSRITKENLAPFTKAVQEIEKAATPLLEEALKIKGAAVIYHTFEGGEPGVAYGSPTRNIRTLVGGAPAGYDPSGKEESANQYGDEYATILQFAFLVDETGIIHVTTGTVPNLSRVTGTPMNLTD